MSKLSRISIPNKLITAKRRAMKYFSPKGAPTLTAVAARSDPKHNLVGIGIGHKLVKGKSTGRHSIRFYVESKLHESVIPKGFLLPKKINGTRTDVIETGRFVALVPRQRRRLRPVRPGCSIGCQPKPGAVMAATFGAIVVKDGKYYILSNNHVLAAENKLPSGSPIFQPGLRDKNAPGQDRVAKLSHFIKLKVRGSNKVDCAIAALLPKTEWNPTVLPRVKKLKSGIPIAAAAGMVVEKVGRSTGYTTGTIEDVNLTLKVGYDLGTLTFVDQILIKGHGKKAFGEGGDSGSLVVERKSKKPVGLMFGGGSGLYALANHLSDVVERLGVTIVARR
jgi:Peptidase family S64